ncbi:hypothetical protein AOLI_G00188350 [Acnodon oligacanthus]
MVTYLQVFVLSFIIYAGSHSAQSRTNISVTVGSTVVLPCDWRNSTQSSSQTPRVVWRTFAGTVFERRGGELYQGEGYEGRVDVPEDHLLKGDCSLELKNVRPEDAGVYESFLLVRRTKTLIPERVFLQIVELSVEAGLFSSPLRLPATAHTNAPGLVPVSPSPSGPGGRRMPQT